MCCCSLQFQVARRGVGWRRAVCSRCLCQVVCAMPCEHFRYAQICRRNWLVDSDGRTKASLRLVFRTCREGKLPVCSSCTQFRRPGRNGNTEHYPWYRNSWRFGHEAAGWKTFPSAYRSLTRRHITNFCRRRHRVSQRFDKRNYQVCPK